jgi:GNAT superfamily N-acetyltransferase
MQSVAGGGIEIRSALAGDAGLLAALGLETFREAFAEFSPPDDMAAYLAASFGPGVQAAELAEASSLFLIAQIDANPVGYARLRLGTPPGVALGQRPVEIVRFYSRKEWIGRGVGPALMRACLREAGRWECDRIWLGVWDLNHRALAFYRTWGFEKVGVRPFRLGHDVSTDLIMQRPVETGAN